jgi:hypothetical protein
MAQNDVATRRCDVCGSSFDNVRTGVVAFTAAPGPGIAITAGFEIDVPVRFDTDTLDVTCIRMGLPDEPLLGALGTNPYWARNWLLFGREVQPIIGAVLIFERGSGGHVGFAIGQDDTHFYVLGGNQSDAVTIARIAKSRFLAARWPATYPPRLQRLPTMKPGEFLSTTNEI